MITLITHNRHKAREFSAFLEPDIKVEVMDFEYPELRSDDPCEIVRAAAKTLAEMLKKPVVVEDSGLFIDALNEFPGTCTAYIHMRIGNDGFAKLMKGVKNRKCSYRSAIGFCMPGKEPVSFLGEEHGRVADRPDGQMGWGQDPIFIPKGKRKTYGKTRSEGSVNIFRKKSLSLLKKHLMKLKL